MARQHVRCKPIWGARHAKQSKCLPDQIYWNWRKTERNHEAEQSTCMMAEETHHILGNRMHEWSTIECKWATSPKATEQTQKKTKSSHVPFREISVIHVHFYINVTFFFNSSLNWRSAVENKNTNARVKKWSKKLVWRLMNKHHWHSEMTN